MISRIRSDDAGNIVIVAVVLVVVVAVSVIGLTFVLLATSARTCDLKVGVFYAATNYPVVGSEVIVQGHWSQVPSDGWAPFYGLTCGPTTASLRENPGVSAFLVLVPGAANVARLSVPS